MNLEDQYDRIFRYLYFHLHDKHAAEDLTQETFLRFLKSRTYRDENRQLQYLYTIARNLCRQHYRDLTITYTLEEQEDLPASESFEHPLIEQIMLLSVITQNSLAVTCGLLGYLIIDLFAAVPDRFRLLQTIWSLRPNAILMNTGFVNYRLIHMAGGSFMSHQAAPVIYAVIAAAAFVLGRWKYRRLQVGR